MKTLQKTAIAMVVLAVSMTAQRGIGGGAGFGPGPGVGGNAGTGTPDPAAMVERRVLRLTALLSLTTTQQAQATTIFLSAATSAQPIHTQMLALHTELQAAIKTNDTAKITSLSGQMATLRAQVMDIQHKASAAFYAILTTDQKAKLESLQGAGFGPGMGGKGPGAGMGNGICLGAGN